MSGNRKLGRTTAHRNAMLRGLVTLLLENGQVETTLARAKEVRSVAEKMITLGKKNTLASRRQALAFITKESVVTHWLPSPRRALLQSSLRRLLPSMRAEMVVTRRSTRWAPAEAMPLKWLSSSWLTRSNSVLTPRRLIRRGVFLFFKFLKSKRKFFVKRYCNSFSVVV